MESQNAEGRNASTAAIAIQGNTPTDIFVMMPRWSNMMAKIPTKRVQVLKNGNMIRAGHINSTNILAPVMKRRRVGCV